MVVNWKGFFRHVVGMFPTQKTREIMEFSDHLVAYKPCPQRTEVTGTDRINIESLRSKFGGGVHQGIPQLFGGQADVAGFLQGIRVVIFFVVILVRKGVAHGWVDIHVHMAVNSGPHGFVDPWILLRVKVLWKAVVPHVRSDGLTRLHVFEYPNRCVKPGMGVAINMHVSGGIKKAGSQNHRQKNWFHEPLQGRIMGLEPLNPIG